MARTEINRVHWSLIALGCFCVFVIAVTLHPNASGHGTHIQLGLPPCGFLTLTGFPCPGCGLTTSFSNLARGQIRAAYDANPFGILLFATMGFTFALSIVGFVRGWDFWPTIVRFQLDRWAIALAVIGLLSWLVRLSLG
ncbi:MAG: DUF2752 domain-containing protein [Polyangiales bacterium]